MIDAIRQSDGERADRLAAAHTRQLRDNFLDFLRRTYASDLRL